MPTTPRGIWTPADSDDWDLTVDWAANAVSIDTAITNAVAEAQPTDTGWVTGTLIAPVTGSLQARRYGNMITVKALVNNVPSVSAGVLLNIGSVPASLGPTGNSVASGARFYNTGNTVGGVIVSAGGAVNLYHNNTGNGTTSIFAITFMAG